MLRHPLALFQGQNFSVEGLKNIKNQLESSLHPIKVSILNAIIDYQVTLESRGNVAYALTNINERNQDIKFILEHLKLNDHDFLLILKGYIVNKSDTSEFKQLINNSISEANKTLLHHKNIRDVYNLCFGIIPLISVAVEQDELTDKKIFLMCILALCTFGIYLINSKSPCIVSYDDKEEKNTQPPSPRRL